MKEYHKIKTVYKRDPATNFKTLLIGQLATPEFEYLGRCRWIFTEKVDGTNIRVMWNGDDVMFGGKTDRAQIPPFLVTRLEDIFSTTAGRESLAETFFGDGKPPSVCLYGEGYGAKIQKGGGNYKADGVDFVLFDVKVGDWWLQREDVEDVALNLGIDAVPIVGEGKLHEATEMAAAGFKSQWGDFPAEGLVMRPATELVTRAGKRIITKIKSKDFRAND